MVTRIEEIDLRDIYPNPNNIRDEINQDDPGLARLTDEISTMGVKTPVTVYENPDTPGEYVLQDGHNRCQAALNAGLTTLPCIVVDAPRRGVLEDLEVMLTTGRNHRSLNRLEEARGFQMMLDLGLNESTIGKKFKQPKSHVKAKARMGEGGKIREAYGYGQLDLEDVLELQRLEDAGQTGLVENVLTLKERRPYQSFAYVLESAKVELEKEQAKEAAEAAGAAAAPWDASYSGKFARVEEDLTPEEHAAAGHQFMVNHRGEEAETEWFEPKKKPATGLTEEEKAEKQKVRELNQGLAVSFRTRRAHLVQRVQDPNSGDTDTDRQMLFELLWFDISRIDEHLLAEITGIPFPAEKVPDALWDDRKLWVDKIKRRISGYSWRQLTRLKALADHYDRDKKLQRTEGFDMSAWDWRDKVQWLERLQEWFGHRLDETETAAIHHWQERNPDELRAEPGKKVMEVDA